MPFCFPPARLRDVLFYVAALSALLGCVRAAHAQALPTQYKTQSISAFAGYLYDKEDFFPRSYDSGVSFGMDFTRHLHFPVQPSLEGRVNLASGNLANERSYIVGVRADVRLGRFYPYVDYLIGFGTIHFNPAAGFGSYMGDKSTVKEPGAGLEYALIHNFRAKIDFQHQYWNVGHTSATAFQPSLLAVGVAYEIPFRPFHRQGEPHYK